MCPGVPPPGARLHPRVSSPRPLCLIDASIYIYRAWHDWPAATRDPAGRPANAVAGFADTLLELLLRERPEGVVCAFDTCGREGVRNVLFPDYKRARPPTPPDLAAQIGRCMTLAPALGIAAFGSRRVEADDIIGHFARLAHERGLPLTIVSGDKDLAQHVAEGDTYWDFGRQPKRDAKALERRLGVRPERIPDWLALCGDRSDGIPGVPGVGPATAARLIRKWGSLDVLYANLDRVHRMRFRGAPGVAARLTEHERTVRLARRLTGSIGDSALPDTLSPLTRRPLTEEAYRAALLAAGLDARRAERGAAALAAIPAATDIA